MQNYLRAKIESFSFIANSPFYQEAALIVFFTRVSQFQERLSAKTSPVSNHWPGYHGAPTDVLAAQNFFKTKIRNVPEDPKRKIYVHFINTTDANVLDKVKASMDDVVAQRKLDAVHEDTLVASEKDA
jgi:hypothetical protein